MRTLARLFAAIAAFFESHASARELVARIAKVEAEQEQWRIAMAQVRVDMAKCKLMVGLNQISDVTPVEY